ncbi:MAG: hypothetical protein B6D59_07830 [Campylobacteraceae bacterium 4484_4]|nr:MAG: hypothetical protein B6D59_07830 [Campylobacteraceae bacterium 4484_4]
MMHRIGLPIRKSLDIVTSELQNRTRRSRFLIEQKAKNIACYHDALLHGLRDLLAVMGKKSIKKLRKKDLLL